MPELNHTQLANLAQEVRQRLELSQAKCAAELEVSFQGVNCWGNGRTNPLSRALKSIEYQWHQVGTGEDLCVKYFAE
ncbi:MAG TPA: hypothetical protein V6D07_13120 [Trichocoleus sp.]